MIDHLEELKSALSDRYEIEREPSRALQPLARSARGR